MYSISGKIRTVEHSLLTIARTQSSQAVGYFCMTPEGCGWACWGALRQGHWGHTFGGHHRTLLLKINEVDSIKWGISIHTLLAVGNFKKRSFGASIHVGSFRTSADAIPDKIGEHGSEHLITTVKEVMFSHVSVCVSVCLCVCVCVCLLSGLLKNYISLWNCMKRLDIKQGPKRSDFKWPWTKVKVISGQKVKIAIICK